MTRITAGVIGKCTVVDRDDDLAYYVSLALLRPNANILDSKYLKYYLESGWCKFCSNGTPILKLAVHPF